MKRIVLLFAVLWVSLSLAGCGSSKFKQPQSDVEYEEADGGEAPPAEEPQAEPAADDVAWEVDNVDSSVAIPISATIPPPPCGVTGENLMTYTLDADFDLGELFNVNHNSPNNDQLQLSPAETTFPFAWIANANEGTVSKLDTSTGCEIGRYRTGPSGNAESPSRTAVDANGNVWVGNRIPNQQASVVQIVIEGGDDRNGNGIIETSGDSNGDCRISSDEMLPWGADERVVRRYLVGGAGEDAGARAVTIDGDGYLWIGIWKEQRYVKLDPDLHSPPGREIKPPEICSVGIAPYRPYGAAVGPDGKLYSAVREPGDRVFQIDTASCALANVFVNGNMDDYGIAVDANGIVWVGNYGGSYGGPAHVWRLNPATGAFTAFSAGSGTSGGRGVTVDFDGNIWMATTNGYVAKFRPDGTRLFTVASGGSVPIGVGVDADGHIWAINQASNNACRLRVTDGAVMGCYPVGQGPYTYSDFTGSLRQITQPAGTWTVVQDSLIAGTEWGIVTWNIEPEGNEPDGTGIVVEARSADACEGMEAPPYTEIFNGVPFSMSGRLLQVRATLDSNSAAITPVLSDLTIMTPPRDIEVWKFLDLDRDGNKDDGEPPIKGVDFHMYGVQSDGSPVDVHAVTDEEGRALFEDAPRGELWIEISDDYGAFEPTTALPLGPIDTTTYDFQDTYHVGDWWDNPKGYGKTIGYWKHQLSVHWIDLKGHAQESKADMTAWMDVIGGLDFSAVYGSDDYVRHDGLGYPVSGSDQGAANANWILQPDAHHHTPEEQLRQQLLATELNYTSGWGYDNDRIKYVLGMFIWTAEWALVNEREELYGQFHDWADALNNNERP